jgi:ribosomal protein S8
MTEKTFVEKLRKCFYEEGFLTEKEVGVGYGVADLVLIKKSKINTRHMLLRKSYRQEYPLLKEGYFRALKYISDAPQKTSLELLIKKTNLSKQFLKYNILKMLETNGYIKSVGKDHYFKINGWIPLVNELVAIEAKMKDWKRGLIQANRYKVFAHKVYLAVPSHVQHLVDKNMLKRHGIGLISLDMNSLRKRTLLAAKTNKPSNSPKNNLAAEYFWNKKSIIRLNLC